MNLRAAGATVVRVLRSPTVHWVLTAAFLLAVGVAFASSLRDQADAVAVAATELSPLVLLGAVALALASLGFAAAAWRTVLAGMGTRLAPLPAARIFLTGHLGTYLPGSAWPLAIQLHLGRRAGVPAPHIVATFVVAVGMLASTGLTAGLSAAPSVLGGHSWWLMAPAAFVLIVLCWPDLLRRAVTWLSRVLRRPQPASGLSARRTRAAFGYSAASWLVNGAQLWLLTVALGAQPLKSLPICVGAMALSILLGSVLPTAPGGLGARELVLVVALGTVMPNPAALVATGASRLVHTVADLLPAAVLALVRGDRTKAHTATTAALSGISHTGPLGGDENEPALGIGDRAELQRREDACSMPVGRAGADLPAAGGRGGR